MSENAEMLLEDSSWIVIWKRDKTNKPLPIALWQRERERERGGGGGGELKHYSQSEHCRPTVCTAREIRAGSVQLNIKSNEFPSI